MKSRVRRCRSSSSGEREKSMVRVLSQLPPRRLVRLGEGFRNFLPLPQGEGEKKRLTSEGASLRYLVGEFEDAGPDRAERLVPRIGGRAGAPALAELQEDHRQFVH